jgi:hypothetical protein
MRKATIVHYNALPRVAPLVGGYLKAYAQTHQEIRDHWDIELYTDHVKTPVSHLIQHLVARAPDVIGFSVYTWNVGIMQRVVPTLRGLLRPTTRYLLGGVEVMHCGDRYIDPSWEDVVVCNGEGERTFAEYLLHLDQSPRQLDAVKGLSFYRDRQYVTTEARPRVNSLDELPSPYLTGAIDLSTVAVATLETNRGCPFACEYCFWGGAIGQKVHKLGIDRIKEEITLIAKHRIPSLYIVDANFGILPRDVEIAQHIVDLKARHHAPNQVIFSSSKNTSDRVEALSRIFSKADMLSTQPISLQSIDPRALALARRDNIKQDTYLRLQQRLNEWDVPSYVELMWPLPGETLESFKHGLDYLCAHGAQAFHIYPLLWLNNVGYREKREELGVVTLKEDDPTGGGEMVIQTREVSYREYVDGLLFATALYLLHDCRGLYLTTRLLHTLGLARLRDVVDEFVRWMGDASGDPLCDLWHDGMVHFEQINKYVWRGALAHLVLHANRKEFDGQLKSFMSERLGQLAEGLGEHEELIRGAVEFDLLNRPYVYLQTPLQLGASLEVLRVADQRRGVWVVDSPFDFSAMVNGLRREGAVDLRHLTRGAFEITLDHRAHQMFLPERTSEEQLHWHSMRVMDEIRHAEARYQSRVLTERMIGV